jgi:hypothetical protein
MQVLETIGKEDEQGREHHRQPFARSRKKHTGKEDPKHYAENEPDDQDLDAHRFTFPEWVPGDSGQIIRKTGSYHKFDPVILLRRAVKVK